MSHRWKGFWIRALEHSADPKYDLPPAPLFRGAFHCSKAPRQTRVLLCGLGWHELYVNGCKFDDRVLAPAVMQYTVHVPFVEYDISGLVHEGDNHIDVLLGNGWYAPVAEDTWSFHLAPWSHWERTKLLCNVVADGKTVLKSDYSWKYRTTPLCFNSLRNGETYDARKETDPEEWKDVFCAMPPPGELLREDMEPCRVCEELKPVSCNKVAGMQMFDFGHNLTGWAKIRVRGRAGAQVTLRYGEKLHEDGSLDQSNIKMFVLTGEFQTDHYILAGKDVPEEWAPRFTYHGFRYVQAEIEGEAEIEEITAQFVHNGFQQHGSFVSDLPALNRLQETVLYSYLSNFTGIPTDCPHREKNGWTGDAQLALETGLWNFDARNAYCHFEQMLADTQTAGGVLSSIAPTGGWGYDINPPWDVALFEIPFQIFRFHNDTSAIKKFFQPMKKYWTFLNSIAKDGVIFRGLGDWCSPVENGTALRSFISSAYLYRMTRYFASAQEIAGCNRKMTASVRERALELAAALRRAFLNPDGTWADGSLTAGAVALCFQLSIEPQADAWALVQAVRKGKHRANFGIIGAKFVPRALAEYGYIDDALELFLQQEYPGWGYCLKQGAVSLWENWKGTSSQNHIMFGDCSAWLYEYLAGFKPGTALIAPQFPEKLNHVKATYRETGMEWERQKDSIRITVLADGDLFHRGMTLRLPDGTEHRIDRKKYQVLITGEQLDSIRGKALQDACKEC